MTAILAFKHLRLQSSQDKFSDLMYCRQNNKETGKKDMRRSKYVVCPIKLL